MTLPHSSDSDQLAERVLILTLSLGNAVQLNHVEEIPALLAERERCVELLVEAGSVSSKRQAQIAEAELHLTRLIEAEKVRALADLQRCHVGKAMSKAYLPAAHPNCAAFQQDS